MCFQGCLNRPIFDPVYLRAPWADFARTALKMTARVPSVQPAHGLPTCRPWLGCATLGTTGPGRPGSGPGPGSGSGVRGVEGGLPTPNEALPTLIHPIIVTGMGCTSRRIQFFDTNNRFAIPVNFAIPRSESPWKPLTEGSEGAG